MPDYDKIYLFRITHIENVPHILENGITHVDSVNKNPDYVAIGDNSLINRRKFLFTPNGKSLGEYIPFYFGIRMPMLYIVQNGYHNVIKRNPDEIVYCISSVQKILELNIPFYFTDGHAVDAYSDYYDQDRISEINDIIDKKAINAKYWTDEKDLDLKRRKEAEFLIEKDVPITGILGFAVYSEAANSKMTDYGVDEDKVIIKKKFYF